MVHAGYSLLLSAVACLGGIMGARSAHFVVFHIFLSLFSPLPGYMF